MPIRILVIYIAFIFVGAACAAPWIYHLVPTEAPFHRYVHRCLLVLALAGLWPFMRGLGIHNWRDLGFAPLKKNWKTLAAGFFVGFCSLAILALLAIYVGGRGIHNGLTADSVSVDIAEAILSAIVVAALEETLFRGALFGALRKTVAWPIALVISSAIYAIVHFFAKPAAPESVNWLSGFVTLASMLRGFGDVETLVPGFFNLLLVGGILALAYQRTGNLFFSMGLHAGWIFWLKSYGIFTTRRAIAHAEFWGGGKMIDGWLATILLAIVFFVVTFCCSKPKTTSDAVA